MTEPLQSRSVPWLLLATLLTLPAHYSYLPSWLWLVMAALFAWRVAIYKQWLDYPSKPIKTLMVLSMLAVFALSVRGINLESAATFLLAASLLKLIELRTRRDGYILVFVGFFVLSVGLLFEQDIGFALLALLAIVAQLLALQSLHITASVSTWNQTQQVLRTMALSLPMMLVLYFLFPRFAPLWSFSLQSGQAMTGLSDDMAAADIAELSQSSELAFRVSFANNQLPAREQLYWRALVLDYYDGRRWSMRHSAAVDWSLTSAPQGNLYEVIQEPTQKNWLFALDHVQAIEPRTGVSADGRLVARRPVFQRLRYQAIWQERPQAIAALSKTERNLYTQLPTDVNPQSRQLAQTLYQQSSSPKDFAQQLMRYFAVEPFYYTLKPQVLGVQEIDEFLFAQRQGFCAHYAGAMTFLARSVGVPARVVTGYQGGEWNPTERYLTVRQFDAHAWVELWFEGQGWLRFDPTAMVAPERIMYSLERAVAEEGTFLQGQLSAYRFTGIGWVTNMRLALDAINYGWQKWVLSYDSERQNDFLRGVLKLKDYQQALYILASSLVGFFLLASLLLWWRLRPLPLSPLLRHWRAVQRQGERLGIEAVAGETVQHYCARLALRYPGLKPELTELVARVHSQLYQAQADAASEQQMLQQMNTVRVLLRRLKRPTAATVEGE